MKLNIEKDGNNSLSCEHKEEIKVMLRKSLDLLISNIFNTSNNTFTIIIIITIIIITIIIIIIIIIIDQVNRESISRDRLAQQNIRKKALRNIREFQHIARYLAILHAGWIAIMVIIDIPLFNFEKKNRKFHYL